MRNKSSARNNIIIAITVSFFAVGGLAVGLAGCEKTKESEKSENVSYGVAEPALGIIEIKERMFMTQVSDVYLNAEDYLGKTIKLEGIFLKEQYRGNSYYYVIRYGPGCCGDDGSNVGFELKWPEEFKTACPATNSWVSTAGLLKVGEDRSYPYLYLDLSSIDVLSRRGAEIVRQ